MNCNYMEQIDLRDILIYENYRAAGEVVIIRDAARFDALYYIKSGVWDVFAADIRVASVTEGLAVYVPAGAALSLRFSGSPLQYAALMFRPYRGGSQVTLGTVSIFPRSDALVSAFAELLSTKSRADDAGIMLRQAAAYTLLSILARDLQSGDRTYQKILPGAQALAREFMENRPLASYAALCGIAEAYFRSLFTAHYGVSPVEYRNRLRISYARALMDHCGLTIADAARAAGFSSASYFCRLYKKTTGMSPGEERRDGEMGD